MKFVSRKLKLSHIFFSQNSASFSLRFEKFIFAIKFSIYLSNFSRNFAFFRESFRSLEILNVKFGVGKQKIRHLNHRRFKSISFFIKEKVKTDEDPGSVYKLEK